MLAGLDDLVCAQRPARARTHARTHARTLARSLAHTALAAAPQRCKTDAFEGLEWDNPERPEARNLLTIYQCVTGLDKEAVAADVAGLRWGEFKPRLADAVVAHLQPIQQRYDEVMSDVGELDGILAAGADAAAREAYATLDNVRQAMGFSMPPVRRS